MACVTAACHCLVTAGLCHCCRRMAGEGPWRKVRKVGSWQLLKSIYFWVVLLDPLVLKAKCLLSLPHCFRGSLVPSSSSAASLLTQLHFLLHIGHEENGQHNNLAIPRRGRWGWLLFVGCACCRSSTHHLFF